MIETVSSHDLKLGMYVAELDRPWLGTPFWFQGFLIEDDHQIADLQACCRSVRVDRLLSQGAQYRRAPHEPDPVRIARNPSEDALAFLAISRQLRSGKPLKRKLAVPPPVDQDGRSRLDAELEYVAPIADEVMRAFESLLGSLKSRGRYEVNRIDGLIGEMAQSVGRNPDALLWLSYLRQRDMPTYDHALSVSVHLMVFGRFLSLQEPRIHAMGVAGLLQDVGKLQLDQATLAKVEPLTDAEIAHVRTHVDPGLALLDDQGNLPAPVRTIIAQHHERVDGSGYPLGLLEGRLDIASQASGMVDSYCAMIERRPYRDALSPQRALEQIQQMRGNAFADALVDQFMQCIGLYPVGTLVELNSGEVAVVIQQHRVRRLQPKVLVLLGPDKSLERYPRSIDLLLSPTQPSGEDYRIVQALPPGSHGLDPRDFFLD